MSFSLFNGLMATEQPKAFRNEHSELKNRYKTLKQMSNSHRPSHLSGINK